MYMNEYDDGLGKFKLKKLMKSPLGPLGPLALLMKKKKKKRGAEINPAPAVDPQYMQEPLPPPTPILQKEPMMTIMPVPAPQYYQLPQPQPQYYQQPQPRPQPQFYQEPQQFYKPEPSARDIPDQYYDLRSDAQIPESRPAYTPENDYPTTNLPIVSAPEFEASDDSEYGWMEGLSEGAAWGDIFSGAASELLARQREKREVKSMARQQAAMTAYNLPKTQGFNLNNMLIPIALAAGGFLLFKSMKKGR